MAFFNVNGEYGNSPKGKFKKHIIDEVFDELDFDLFERVLGISKKEVDEKLKAQAEKGKTKFIIYAAEDGTSARDYLKLVEFRADNLAQAKDYLKVWISSNYKRLDNFEGNSINFDWNMDIELWEQVSTEDNIKTVEGCCSKCKTKSACEDKEDNCAAYDKENELWERGELRFKWAQ